MPSEIRSLILMPLCDIKTRLDCGNYASDSRCLFRQYRLSAGEVSPSRNESRSVSLCSAGGRLPVVRRHFPPQSVGTGALLLVSENLRFSGAALTPPPSEKTPNNSEIICCDIPSDVVRALDDGHDCIPYQNVSPKSLRTTSRIRPRLRTMPDPPHSSITTTTHTERSVPKIMTHGR